LTDIRHGQLPDLGSQVIGQLGVHGTGLDQADPNVAPGHLLAQRLRESPHPELRHVVDPGTVAGVAARDRADVHHVRHLARAAFRGADEVGQRGVGAVEQAEEVEVDHPLQIHLLAPVIHVGSGSDRFRAC
jgi:hypothetical protein